MDQYHISDLPQRFIMTQHYQSSLNQPNLQNVQARLNATRQRNHDLALSYFRSKYGSAQAYEQFTKHHNMGQFKSTHKPTSEELLKQHLANKALEIQKRFYHEDNVTLQNHQDSQNKQPQWIRKVVNKSQNNNPWLKPNKIEEQQKKKKKIPQTAHVDSVLVPKNKQSEFLHQFKNYLQTKQRQKSQQKKIPQNTLNITKISQSKFQNTKQVNRSFNVQPTQQKKKKCYQQQLAKKIFKQICGECKSENYVDKFVLFQYLVQNQKILKVLGINQYQLNSMLMNNSSQQQSNSINLQQFTYFILKVVGKQKEIHHFKQQKSDKPPVSQGIGCMLSKQLIAHFEKVFKQLDHHKDLIVKRLVYIDRLANDPLVKGQLNSPAIYQGQLQKVIILRRVFERIEMECLFGNEENVKAKEYISWNQFLDYFKAGVGNPTLYNIIELIQSLHKSEVVGLSYVPDIVIKIVSESVSKQPYQRGGYFNTASLIQSIIQHQKYDNEKYTQVRQQSKISNLPDESLEQVLLRIKQQGEIYMNLKQFLQYFSNKGRPFQQFEQIKNIQLKKQFSGTKVNAKQLISQHKNQKIDGYDSDPQFYRSKLHQKHPQPKQSKKKKLQQSSSFVQGQHKNQFSKKQFKVTIPVPFSFQTRQKTKQRIKLNKTQNDHRYQLKNFKAKPIPSKVLQQGLYERMLEEDKKKIQERKKNSMIMTLANEKPFNFQNRKSSKRNQHQRQQYIFKAKPIPWYCSINLLQKKKQNEIVRNQKIAKQAQESLSKAKLPPRMQRDFQEKQIKNNIDTQLQKNKKYQQKPKLYKQPPNFQKLHRQFQQSLQRKRKQNKTTIPQQFNFTQKNLPRPKSINIYPIQQISQKKNQLKKYVDHKSIAHSTTKYEQQVKKRRQQMEKKQKQQQELKNQEQKRQQINQELKNKLISITEKNKQKQKLNNQDKKIQLQQQMKNFQLWKKNCLDKAKQQPMLIQRPLKRDQRIEKMRKLYQISQTLKGNGLKGKQHDSYFNKQELLMLQDWEHLKDKL